MLYSYASSFYKFQNILGYSKNLFTFCATPKDDIHYGEDFTHGFDTQTYPKLQASLGTQPENTHGIQRETQPNPYPWIFSGNTLGYPP